MGIGYIGAGTNDAKFAAETGITATASGTQATGFRLTNVVSRITACATAGDSVVLPAAKAGLVRWVTNLGAAALDIYPEVGDSINSLAANVAVRISPNSRVSFTTAADGSWHMSGATLPDAKFTKNTTSGATTAAAGNLSGAKLTVAEFSAVGAADLTTRTAAQMFADQGNVQPGDSYLLRIINTSGGTTTVVAGSGVTLTGTATLATNTTRDFVVTFTSATALTMQSVGVGTIS